MESAKASHAHSQRLERWSLEVQAYDFTVAHRPGKDNCHVDSLSRLPVSLVALQAPMTAAEISSAQRNDPTLSVVVQALENDDACTATKWKQFPLRRYHQIWQQPMLHETVLCRKVKSPTMAEEKFLILVPASLRKLFLPNAHDKAAHQGADHNYIASTVTNCLLGWHGKGYNTLLLAMLNVSDQQISASSASSTATNYCLPPMGASHC